MTPRQIRAYCELSADCERLLERAMTQQGLTARAHDRILKVARTVADLEGAAGHRAQAHRRSHPVPHPGPHFLGMKEKTMEVKKKKKKKESRSGEKNIAHGVSRG